MSMFLHYLPLIGRPLGCVWLPLAPFGMPFGSHWPSWGALDAGPGSRRHFPSKCVVCNAPAHKIQPPGTCLRCPTCCGSGVKNCTTKPYIHTRRWPGWRELNKLPQINSNIQSWDWLVDSIRASTRASLSGNLAETTIRDKNEIACLRATVSPRQKQASGQNRKLRVSGQSAHPGKNSYPGKRHEYAGILSIPVC